MECRDIVFIMWWNLEQKEAAAHDALLLKT
jgi:hypothetical protein